jgi:hypothetical protein
MKHSFVVLYWLTSMPLVHVLRFVEDSFLWGFEGEIGDLPRLFIFCDSEKPARIHEEKANSSNL